MSEREGGVFRVRHRRSNIQNQPEPLLLLSQRHFPSGVFKGGGGSRGVVHCGRHYLGGGGNGGGEKKRGREGRKKEKKVKERQKE